MTPIKIVDENKAVIGVIPAFDTKQSLANLRREIQEDFEILDFNFMREESGQQIENDEEAVTKVASILELAAVKVPIVNIKKRTLNPIKSCGESNFKPMKTTRKIETVSVSSVKCTSEDQTVSSSVSTNFASLEKQTSASTSFLRSPTSWEIRGVKLYEYTEEEISKAKGMEKKRRLFWKQS